MNTKICLKNWTLLVYKNLIFIIICLLSTPTFAFDCSSLAPSGKADNSIEAKIEGAADALFKLGKVDGNVSGKIKAEVTNVFETYPDANETIVKNRLIYLYCLILDDSKDISDTEKFDRLDQLIHTVLKVSTQEENNQQKIPVEQKDNIIHTKSERDNPEKNNQQKTPIEQKENSPLQEDDYIFKAKITEKTGLNLRKTKNLSDSNVLKVINKDEIFYTKKQDNESEWISVKTKEGEIGFLKRKYVIIVDDKRFYKKSTVYTKSGQNVILRSSPVKKKGNEIGKIATEETFYTYPQSKSNEYIEVLAQLNNTSTIGYISRQYLRDLNDDK